ncbi:MAG: M48 family metallopeptidase [Planctomycetes bacterium]|nr:M48 family metallopeptidase [Planctomycetota bacterium]
MKNQTRPFLPSLIIILSFTGIACSTVPYTGRSRMNIMGKDTENQMGFQAYQEVLGAEKIVQSGSSAEMVKRVASRIAAAADRDAQQRGEPLGFDWQVSLIESSQVNAWCLPGGKMGVYSGILSVAKSEAGLAVVMAHEVGHAVARHGGERMTQQLGAQIALGLADLGLSKTDQTTHDTVMAALGTGSQVAVLLPFSRAHESEADHIGILLMAEAGYDPREAPKLWERMVQLGGDQPPALLSTHPSHETRIQQLNGWVPEAMKVYNPNSTASATVNKAQPGLAPPAVPKVQGQPQNVQPKPKK